MKTATLIVTLSFLLVVIPCRAAEKAAEHQERIRSRLGNQEGRLQDIEEVISRQRQDIEQRYAHNLGMLQQEYARRFRKIATEKRTGAIDLLWVEFFEFVKMTSEEPYAVSYFSNLLEPFRIKRKIAPKRKELKLRNALAESYFLILVQDFFVHEEAREVVAQIWSSGLYPRCVRNKAWKLLETAKLFDADAAYLCNRREVRLAALEQRERELKEGVYRVMREIRAKAEKPQAGVVSAIGYTEKKAYCMVEGVDRILGAGEIIDNVVIKDVKVVGIDRDKVEFEKDGRRWTQKVGQKPKAEDWK